MSKPRPYRPPACHTEPRDIPQFVNFEIPGFGTVMIALGQTFGVEIELTTSEDIPDADSGWRATAVMIIELLKKHVTATVHPVPLTGKGGPLDAWRVTYDSSCGWEVVSPILVDAGGFDELRRACTAITELVNEGGGLRVNHCTGLHITLATRLDTDEKLRGFVRLVQRVEPGLFTLVPRPGCTATTRTPASTPAVSGTDTACRFAASVTPTGSTWPTSSSRTATATTRST